jgi:tRNA(Ile)-lysidine synthase
VVVRLCLEETCGLTDVGMVHVEAVEGLLDKQSGKRVCLPRGGIACRCFGSLVFEAGETEPQAEPELSFSWQVEAFSGTEFLKNLKKISTSCYTKWFDYDKIKACCGSGAPVLRTPREGDYLFVTREGQRKRLSIYLKQEKIPQKQRAAQPVVAWGNVILWVFGHRDSACFFVTEETTQILRLDIGRKEEGEYHGRDFSFDQ